MENLRGCFSNTSEVTSSDVKKKNDSVISSFMHFLFHYPNRRGIGFYGCSASPAFGELRESLSVWKCMFWNGLVASEWIRKREFPSRERERGGVGRTPGENRCKTRQLDQQTQMERKRSMWGGASKLHICFQFPVTIPETKSERSRRRPKLAHRSLLPHSGSAILLE